MFSYFGKIVRYLNFHSQLVIKMVKVNSDPYSGEGTIWFDYFNVTGDFNVTGGSNITGASNVTGDSNVTGASNVTGDPNVTGVPSLQKKNNVGAIVEGVVGGISILIFFVLLLYFYRRRRLSKRIPVDPCESLHNHQAYISHALSSSSALRPYPAKRKPAYYDSH